MKEEEVKRKQTERNEIKPSDPKAQSRQRETKAKRMKRK
jgi:hypothetical protein